MTRDDRIGMNEICGCGFCRDIRKRKEERDIEEFISLSLVVEERP